jgi:hypothetical protein
VGFVGLKLRLSFSESLVARFFEDQLFEKLVHVATIVRARANSLAASSIENSQFITLRRFGSLLGGGGIISPAVLPIVGAGRPKGAHRSLNALALTPDGSKSAWPYVIMFTGWTGELSAY